MNASILQDKILVIVRVIVRFCRELGTKQTNVHESSNGASISLAIFFVVRNRRVHPSESPVPIFRLCRAGLTRDAAGHKNVDSVNERNWRFLFPSWRSSSRTLFYAPPSSAARPTASLGETQIGYWILRTSLSAPTVLDPCEDPCFLGIYDLSRKRNY